MIADIALLPYDDIDGSHITRGKLFYCGRCSQIYDTETEDSQNQRQMIKHGDKFTDEITKQARANEVVFEVIPTRAMSLSKSKRDLDRALDPGDDEKIKQSGWKIVHTRITSADCRLIRND